MVAQKKRQMTMPDGRTVEGTEIQIDTANERWSEYTLEDGTVFRMKVNLVSVVRADHEYDPQGMPVYQVNGQPAIVVVDVPVALQRKKQ